MTGQSQEMVADLKIFSVEELKNKEIERLKALAEE